MEEIVKGVRNFKSDFSTSSNDRDTQKNSEFREVN